MNIAKDVRGVELRVGQQVAKASRMGNRAYLEVKRVTRVEDGRVYLNDWHQPVGRHDLLAVIGGDL